MHWLSGCLSWKWRYISHTGIESTGMNMCHAFIKKLSEFKTINVHFGISVFLLIARVHYFSTRNANGQVRHRSSGITDFEILTTRLRMVIFAYNTAHSWGLN